MNDRGVEVDESDTVEVLILTITLHFLGNPKEEQASFKTILINLRCSTLTDYRWYKDVFLANVPKEKMILKTSGKKDLLLDYLNCSGKGSSINYARILGPVYPFWFTNIWINFRYCQTEGLNLYNEIKLQYKYGSEGV